LLRNLSCDTWRTDLIGLIKSPELLEEQWSRIHVANGAVKKILRENIPGGSFERSISKSTYFLAAFFALSAANTAFAESTILLTVESAFLAVVSATAFTVSVAALAAESTLLELDSVLLLQAVMAPATIRIANNFFIRLYFKF
jgi:hypothetical protein